MLAVTGFGVLCSAGVGPGALVAALACDRQERPDPGRDVTGLYPDPLPTSTAHALAGFDVRQILGRKGTSFLDRRSSLALVACAEAVKDSGLMIDDENRTRIGITLGTTWGSLAAMSDFTRDTLVEQRPYLVNPARFPNTVMNCAAGQAAIWYRLKGVNATIAGDQMAFLQGLEYSANVLRRGYADTILAGAVEEFTPHTAWATSLMRRNGSAVVAGEAAAVFVVERSEAARQTGKRVDAEILSVDIAFAPGGASGGRMTGALERCIGRALGQAHVDAADLSLVATCEDDDDGIQIEADALAAANAGHVRRILVKRAFGECHAAVGCLQVAALLALHRNDPGRDGDVSLVTGWTREGSVGAAVMRGWSRVGTHHG